MSSSEGRAMGTGTQHSAVPALPGVIPTNQVVILRERELDCDLATAIRRIRARPETSRSRILIVGPASEADEPRRGRVPGLPLPQLPTSVGQVARSGGKQALVAIGSRLRGKVDSLRRLLLEGGRIREDLAEAAEDGARAQILSRVKGVAELLSWLEAAVEDLGEDVVGVAAGFEQVDAWEILQDLQGSVESFFPDLRVNVAPPSGDPRCWGCAPELAEGLFLGLVLTAHRIGGVGSLNTQVQPVGGRLQVRLLGLGEPSPVHVAEERTRFREIIVTRHRGRIVPDSMGPFGTGMLIEIPTEPDC